MADNFGPQIGTSADSYFQSDRDVAIQQSRAAKSGNNFGEPIKCSSKVLCMLLLTTPDVYAYVGESGFLARKINLAVCALVIVIALEITIMEILKRLRLSVDRQDCQIL